VHCAPSMGVVRSIILTGAPHSSVAATWPWYLLQGGKQEASNKSLAPGTDAPWTEAQKPGTCLRLASHK